jgi:phage baseplate assembly protein gpV
MFRSLLAHPQQAPHKRHLVYCVRVMSSWCNQLTTRTQYTKCRLWAPAEDEQVVLEIYRGP